MSDLTGQDTSHLETGILGLDAILGSGFLKANLYIIMGPPGAGKTIMANQIAFHQAAHGRKVVYITVLAESHGMMLRHLRHFSFFDAALVSDALVYYSGYSALDEEGLSGLLAWTHRVVRAEEPVLVVFDGMATAEASAKSDLDFKRFVHELQQLVGSYDCTALLLSHTYDTSREHVEHTMVDGILELYAETLSVRTARAIQVHKIRGARQLPGRHVFEITDAGLSVYPRIEAHYRERNGQVFDGAERYSTGVESLDAMLGGGLHTRSTTLILGNSGSGKTLMGLSFLAAGARADERGLYFGFGESPGEIVAKADAASLNFSAHVEAGRIAVCTELPLEGALDIVGTRILEKVETHGAQRLVLDGLQGFQQLAFYPERLPRFLTALASELRSRGITMMISSETQRRAFSELAYPPETVASVAGTVIELRQLEVGARTHRLINVSKMHQGTYDANIHEFTISEKGLRVAPTSESAERLLTGRASDSPSAQESAAGAK